MKKNHLSVQSRRIIVFLFLFFIVLSIVLFSLFRTGCRRFEKEQTISELQYQGSNIQYAIDSTLYKLNTLNVFVTFSDGELSDFEKTAKLILKDENVRNIALAPDCVIRNIYPLEGNEQALGLDLLSEKNASRAEARLAILSKQMTIAGPYELAQGGSAVSGRLPVFLKNADGKEELWGLITLTLNMEQLLTKIQLNRLADVFGYHYELYHYDPNTNEKTTIDSSGTLSTDDFVEYQMTIQNDIWYLRAEPTDGWFPVTYRILFGCTALFLNLLLCTLASLLLFLRDTWKLQAYKDSLTQVYNHQYMEVYAKERLRRKSSKYAYLMIDVDNFKQVNDTLGHYIGDEILIMISNVLKQSLGKSALIARPGGDEFTALVPYHRKQDVLTCADRIIQTVQRKITSDGKTVDISCSIGITFYPTQANSWDQLKIFADQALYQCKSNGKGKYHVYNAP